MSAAYEFTQAARGLKTDAVWQEILRLRGEPYADQLTAACSCAT
jgi:hypothetical protein